MIRLLSGDCRDVLATLPAESVQCVVCSPPYYGLRDYGTALWDGGDADCDHGESYRKRRNEQRAADCGDGGIRRSERDPQTGQCSCGAVRVDRQIGLEATPDEYLATMVGVFREVRRVLRRDGTCWVNMGDSYGHGTTLPQSKSRSDFISDDYRVAQSEVMRNGLKPKDLLLMPARLALALQADGWWVRSDIIWHKPNPMPESVTDRPTSAHEHVFLLTRSSRYYYDNDAVRERQDEPWRSTGRIEDMGSKAVLAGINGGFGLDGQRPREYNPAGRNLRNVWTIATHAYSAAHFATFPPELAERCIKAGTSERGCCAACGKPWWRVTQASGGILGKSWHDHSADAVKGNAVPVSIGKSGEEPYQRTTTGWAPGCDHNADVVPCVVLDPFAGAGTTLLCSDRLQRDAIGIELNVDYTRMAMDRCVADAPLFTSFPPAEPPEDERMGDLFAGDEYQQMPAAVPDERRDAFRNSGRYVNQGPQPSNGVTDMAAD